MKADLVVEEDNPRDTFFDYDCKPECYHWKHGAVFVNGFNVGRYHTAGPQRSLYIPGPFLHKGSNDIVIMELYENSDVVKFTDTPNYGPESGKKKP